MRIPTRFLALLALVLALSACPAARRAPATDQPQTTVEVENRNFLDMRVFVFRGGHRVRLGTVTGLSTQVLAIPPNLIFGPTSLRFLADPVGGRATPISHEITVTPGDRVHMVIPPS